MVEKNTREYLPIVKEYFHPAIGRMMIRDGSKRRRVPEVFFGEYWNLTMTDSYKTIEEAETAIFESAKQDMKERKPKIEKELEDIDSFLSLNSIQDIQQINVGEQN